VLEAASTQDTTASRFKTSRIETAGPVTCTKKKNERLFFKSQALDPSQKPAAASPRRHAGCGQRSALQICITLSVTAEQRKGHESSVEQRRFMGFVIGTVLPGDSLNSSSQLATVILLAATGFT